MDEQGCCVQGRSTIQRWLAAAGYWPKADEVLERSFVVETLAGMPARLGDRELQAVMWVAIALWTESRGGT